MPERLLMQSGPQFSSRTRNADSVSLRSAASRLRGLWKNPVEADKAPPVLDPLWDRGQCDGATPVMVLEVGIQSNAWRSAYSYPCLHEMSGLEICSFSATRARDFVHSVLFTQSAIRVTSAHRVRAYWRRYDLWNASIAEERLLLDIRQKLLEIAEEGYSFGLQELFVSRDRVTGCLDQRRFIMRSPNRLVETVSALMIRFLRNQLLLVRPEGVIPVRFARRIPQPHLCIDLRSLLRDGQIGC